PPWLAGNRLALAGLALAVLAGPAVLARRRLVLARLPRGRLGRHLLELDERVRELLRAHPELGGDRRVRRSGLVDVPLRAGGELLQGVQRGLGLRRRHAEDLGEVSGAEGGGAGLVPLAARVTRL